MACLLERACTMAQAAQRTRPGQCSGVCSLSRSGVVTGGSAPCGTGLVKWANHLRDGPRGPPDRGNRELDRVLAAAHACSRPTTQATLGPWGAGMIGTILAGATGAPTATAASELPFPSLSERPHGPDRPMNQSEPLPSTSTRSAVWPRRRSPTKRRHNASRPTCRPPVDRDQTDKARLRPHPHPRRGTAAGRAPDLDDSPPSGRPPPEIPAAHLRDVASARRHSAARSSTSRGHAGDRRTPWDGAARPA
jgi:hypothetical protein